MAGSLIASSIRFLAALEMTSKGADCGQKGCGLKGLGAEKRVFAVGLPMTQ